MARRFIEILIGRLITDERFRADFTAAPEHTLRMLEGQGIELSGAEVAALVNTDSAVWAQAAGRLDPRLQKIDLSSAANA